MEVAARIAIWGFAAFWFWLLLALVFSRLRIPYAAVIAAVLGWIGAGLLATWMLPSVIRRRALPRRTSSIFVAPS